MDSERLVLEHLPRVGVLARLIRRPPSVEWKDLAQEGILAMIEAAPRYKEVEGPFWAFVRPRIHGAMLDFIGRACRETFHVEPSRDHLSGQDSTPGLESKIDLERALASLTRQQKRVFHALKDGHRPKTIAGMMRISPRRFRKIQEQGVKRLRKKMVA